MHLGVSPSHSDTVGRILNLRTGAISCQYHMVFDEQFSTVFGQVTDDVIDPQLWDTLLKRGSEENYLDKHDSKDPHVINPARDLFDSFVDTSSSSTSVPEGVASDSDSESDYSDSDTDSDDDETSVESLKHRTTRSGRQVRRPERYDDALYAATCLHSSPVVLKTKSERYAPFRQEAYLAGGNVHGKVKAMSLQDQALHGLDWTLSTLLSSAHFDDTKRALLNLLNEHESSGGWDPFALAAKLQDETSLTWEQAMNSPYRVGYKKAARVEIETLRRMGVWDVVKRQPWMKVLPSTWTFRAKLFPSGLLRKLKARFCMGGHKQVAGRDYFINTFAPVVSWTTVRLMLILTAQYGLATRQVDYTAAFVHADINKPPNYDSLTPEEQERCGVFVEMPRGFAEPGMVLKLKKNLYGGKQAPKNWFLFLKQNLEAIGFQQATEIDPCLFISDKVICLVYVDDTLLFSRNMADIDDVIRRLKDDCEMKLEVEDDVAGFLGVDIRRDTETGRITLTQKGLTDRILEALDVDALPTVDTPADTTLGKDENGEPPNCTFNYASVIGLIWYLYRHSRPDLGFAISQAARFSFNPKRSHELALIRIGQYLKGTRDRGLILEPITDEHFIMDVYCDSDFMGLYGKEKRVDPDNVKSRAGFVICLNKCPIIWSSKLMEPICLSTMMAEYYALSLAMREVLPLRDLVKVVAHGSGIPPRCVTNFKTSVWEDNMGALTLANLEPGQHTSRSKFYDVKVHWFRSELGPDITVQKIDTKLQLADLFTKPLLVKTFTTLRKLLMGW